MSGLAVGLALTAGLAGGVQVAVMGVLGERIGSFEALAFSALVTAALSAAALVAARQSLAGYATALREPVWLWTGGAMGALIVFSITLAGARIGTTATVALLIAGNLTMAAVIDRYGLFGAERIPLGWPRLFGIALLAVGAALSLRK